MDFIGLCFVIGIASANGLRIIEHSSTGPEETLYVLLIGNDFVQQFPLIGYGGIEARVESTALGLYKAGIPFSVICPKVTQSRQAYPFEVIEMPFVAGGNKYHFIEQVREHIASMDRKPNVIWSQSDWSADALHTLGIPMVVTHGDSGDARSLHFYRNVVHRFLSFNQMKRWSRVNEWMRKDETDKFATALWAGFPDHEFQFFDRNDRDDYVLFVGDGDAKGSMEFLQLAKMNPNVTFVNYGGHRATAQSLPNVQFRGTLKRGQEHNDAFGKAKFVLVFSKWEEAFGRVNIEALSKGTPVLGSAHGAIPELIPEFAGVASNDIHDLHQALQKEYDHKRIFEYSKTFSNTREIELLMNISRQLIA